MAFTSQQTLTAALLNTAVLAGTVLGRARRTTSSSGSTSTTLVPVLRLDDIPIIGGRAYNVMTTPLLLDTSVANDVGRIAITYTTDGSTPTISSTIMPGTEYTTVLPNPAVAQGITGNTTYVPASNETLSLLLCVSRFSGTGTITILGSSSVVIEMKIVDGGVDPGDTGVDL